MNRTEISVGNIGLIERVALIPLADDPERGLLMIFGESAKVTIEVRLDDVWPIAIACRDGARMREAQVMTAARS